MVDYANLSRDILQEIIKFLSFSDYIRLSVVCSAWHEVAKERHHFLQKQLPWLISFNNDCSRFLNLSEEKVYQIEISELHGRLCVGSSHGWLITIDIDLNMNLLDPFSKAQVKLPQLEYDASNALHKHFYESFRLHEPEIRRDMFIYKGVLSGNPYKSFDYIVIVILFGNFKLGFWRPGDLIWTTIDSDFFVEDVIWYNGAFYVVGAHGQVCLVELGMNHKLIEISSTCDNDYLRVNRHLEGMEKYLVDFMGDLVLVYRHYIEGNNDEDDDYHTRSFMLFKLDQKVNKFIELKSINNNILVLGANHAMLIPTTTVVDKTKSNIIYFSDDYKYSKHKYGYNDSGVYNIRDQSVTLFPLRNIYHQAKQPIFLDVSHGSF
ncbi:F-box domain-containing protein [Dioscorea alata]|uniref:F-box domain-containing protein n=1 Tax=Dioscorea alata TaxID=55571 RepID=A0ACB7UE64_DIOAL|nr:F-box domain-containing protein [Dioscorea alata]